MTAGSRISSSRSEAGWTIVLVVGLAALLGLRLVALTLNGTNLFFDEAQYWTWSQDLDFGYYSKPPLIAWIIIFIIVIKVIVILIMFTGVDNGDIHAYVVNARFVIEKKPGQVMGAGLPGVP